MMCATRWLGVGQAEGSEPEAGARATEQALERDDAKLLVVFCSEAQDMSAVLQQIRSRAGDVPLIGCSTAGEIAPSGVAEGSVVVTALGGDGFSIATTAAGNASSNLRAAGAQAASCLAKVDDRPHRVLLLL